MVAFGEFPTETGELALHTKNKHCNARKFVLSCTRIPYTVSLGYRHGTAESWHADDVANMAVRAGSNTEYGREPDYENEYAGGSRKQSNKM